MDDICIILRFSREDLECIVCYGDLDEVIYQCSKGPHYVCGKCYKKIGVCPVCRSGLIRNIMLEEQLRPFMMECVHAHRGCCKKVFGWNESHVLECDFGPVFCGFCRSEVSGCGLDAYANHIENFCCKEFVFMTYPKVNKFKFVITIHRMKPVAFKIREKYLFMFVPIRKIKAYDVVIVAAVNGESVRCLGKVNENEVSPDKYNIPVCGLRSSIVPVRIPFGLEDDNDNADAFVFECSG